MCFWNYYGLGGWFIPIIMFGMFVIMVLVMQPIMRCRIGSDCRWPLFRNNQQTDDEALGIVKRRYANGEISKEDFEKIKMTLS